jgi:lipopolysaccharide transport system ATP-binding protein
MSVAIKVENLSKIYRLGEIGTGTISRDMERWFRTRVLKQKDPFLRIGETNDRASKGESDIVYSLRDINFEINQGDAVGIIGRNGAGKSTLLKILSRVTTPTTGRINIKGRVASLLEVGTGFHPELTGKENIYLNGGILGMRKREIDRKLDEIIDFSGVERYIDTPVKRYSSGMYVRLAFAVAAHLESEILIVDEVLAVGDAEFQKKCLGKMGEVSKGEGKTVLFVSHNMGTILQLCQNSILLKNGNFEAIGPSFKIVEQYYDSQKGQILKVEKSDKNIFFKEIYTCNSKGECQINFAFQQDIHLRMIIGVNMYEDIQNIGVCLLRQDKKRVFTVNKSFSSFYSRYSSEVVVDFIIEGSLIAPMDYSFLVALNTRTGLVTYEWQEDICPIKVYDDGTDLAFAEGMDYGCIILKDKWSLIKS